MMLLREGALQRIVGLGCGRMRADVIAKVQVPLDIQRVSAERVDLVRTDTGWGVLPKVSPTRDAKLAERLVTESRQGGRRFIQRRDAIDNGKHVDHGLGNDAGDRRTTDVVKSHEAGTKGVLNSIGLLLEG